MVDMRDKRYLYTLIIFGIGLLVAGSFFQSSTKDENSDRPALPAGTTQTTAGDTNPPAVPADARVLRIEKIGVYGEILEGDETTLDEGIWHLPRTSTPDKGGNTVISAHRWKYLPPDPRTFYNLDTIVPGDEIEVFWDDVLYTYEVVESFVVTPDRVDILAPTDEAILTLFTCTPLYSTDKRLVVRARLVEGE